ncbi:MAG: LytTR family DNA-binding domain-containing protein [Bacteroidales bacterium]|nr:LytTR family DNA-binding domain-containing protein [Bacteroidales bacterium]MCF8336771.1 LytTR family DNA-binding domain-containing protein [Bacteroidales bacterium]
METTINTLIVDDEMKSLSVLRRMLQKHCPKVKIVGESRNVDSAIQAIETLHPDLVFLDIVMPDGQGFDVLEHVTYTDFDVVFVTAYDEYALRAFEFSALHYILKPLNYLSLVDAVERVIERQSRKYFEEKVEVFKQSINEKPEKIILPTGNGLEIILIDDIIRLEADGNYTLVYLKDNTRKIVSKSISNFEKLLDELSFSRLHNSHMINLQYLVRYIKGKPGYVIMADEKHIYISAGRKQTFLDKLSDYAKSV